MQATKHVSNFVCDNDEPGNLLIVYYAGHGWAENDSDGRLSLSGRFPEHDSEKDMSIEWIEVERTLEQTKSDVLVIFDCCHAGLLCCPAVRGAERSFYYVAACKADQVTRSAGKKSFTTAMIWALEKLANNPAFPVTRLVNTLMKYESFPRNDQEAVIYPSRFGQGEREIWISPIRAQSATPVAQEHPSETRQQEDLVRTADVLDLRFHFANHTTPKHIEDTAAAFKKFMENEQSLHFHRISFVNHTSFLESTAKRWLDMYRRKASAKENTTPLEQSTTLASSAAIVESFKNRLLQVKTGKDSDDSAASTTAVGTPATVSCSWEESSPFAKPDIETDGVLYHLIMALGLLLVKELQAILAWKFPVVWVALLASSMSSIWYVALMK